MNGQEEDAVIIFSYIGYITQELNSSATMSVVMKEDIANLEEVIVTGYGGTIKKDLVSAISQIKGEAISNQPASRVDNLLQGGVKDFFSIDIYRFIKKSIIRD